MTLRIGIVGAGGIARGHAWAIADVPGAKLTAISDVIPEASKRGAEAFGVPGFIDHKEMFKSGLVDAVTVCTPHWFHPKITIDALKAGLHVLTEKPMAVTAEDCDKMIAAAKKSRKVLQVVYQRRYTPPLKKFHDLIKKGAVGRVFRVLLTSTWFRSDFYYASADWRGTWKGEGGGVLMNQGPHPIDAMLFVSCVDPVKIMAVTDTFLHPKIEVEDRVSALLWFKNGATGYMHICTDEAPTSTIIEVAGDKGKIVFDNGKLTQHTIETPVIKHMRSSKEKFSSPKATTKDITPKPAKGRRTVHYALMKDFVQSIAKGKKPIVSGEEGRRSVEVINGAILSGKLGKSVDLPVSRPAFKKLMNRLIAESGRKTKHKK